MIDALSFIASITLTSCLVLLTTGLFYAIVSWACRQSISHSEPGKNEIFAGGENLPPSKAYVMSSQLFTGLWKGTFKTAYTTLRDMHSGLLDDWLSWALLSMAILTIALLSALR